MSTETQRAEFVSIEQARTALDDMDDYARMTLGVDAAGPRGQLERFIEQQASQAAEIEALRKDAERWATVRACALEPEGALSLRVLAAMGQLPESRTASDIDAAVDAAMQTKEAS